MNVPDELIKAVAEALHGYECGPSHPYTKHEVLYLGWERKATIALQTTFAQLPECEKVVSILAETIPLDPFVARLGLVALAEKFGGKK